jgi:hypothetical protein
MNDTSKNACWPISSVGRTKTRYERAMRVESEIPSLCSLSHTVILPGEQTEYWYSGELGFFDYYIIPLAKKLDTCGMFGVSSDEYLNYATANRHEWEMKGIRIVEEMAEKYSSACKVEDTDSIVADVVPDPDRDAIRAAVNRLTLSRYTTSGEDRLFA